MSSQTDTATTSRTKRLLLRVSPHEKALIERNAADLGLGLSAYLRAVGQGRRLTPRRPAINDEAIRQLASIGNNLNQIAYQLNRRGKPDIPLLVSELKAYRKIRTAIYTALNMNPSHDNKRQ